MSSLRSRKTSDTTAVNNNEKLFPLFAKRLSASDVQTYSGAAIKLGMWLNSDRAYYVAARPKIVELLETAEGTLYRVIDGGSGQSLSYCIANCSPYLREWVDAYVGLIKTITPYIRFFTEPDLHQRLIALSQRLDVTPVESTQWSAMQVDSSSTPPVVPSGNELAKPVASTSDVVANSNHVAMDPQLSMHPSSSSLASALEISTNVPPPSSFSQTTNTPAPSFSLAAPIDASVKQEPEDPLITIRVPPEPQSTNSSNRVGTHTPTPSSRETTANPVIKPPRPRRALSAKKYASIGQSSSSAPPNPVVSDVPSPSPIPAPIRTTAIDVETSASSSTSAAVLPASVPPLVSSTSASASRSSSLHTQTIAPKPKPRKKRKIELPEDILNMDLNWLATQKKGNSVRTEPQAASTVEHTTASSVEERDVVSAPAVTPQQSAEPDAQNAQTSSIIGRTTFSASNQASAIDFSIVAEQPQESLTDVVPTQTPDYHHDSPIELGPPVTINKIVLDGDTYTPSPISEVATAHVDMGLFQSADARLKEAPVPSQSLDVLPEPSGFGINPQDTGDRESPGSPLLRDTTRDAPIVPDTVATAGHNLNNASVTTGTPGNMEDISLHDIHPSTPANASAMDQITVAHDPQADSSVDVLGPQTKLTDSDSVGDNSKNLPPPPCSSATDLTLVASPSPSSPDFKGSLNVAVDQDIVLDAPLILPQSIADTADVVKAKPIGVPIETDGLEDGELPFEDEVRGNGPSQTPAEGERNAAVEAEGASGSTPVLGSQSLVQVERLVADRDPIVRQEDAKIPPPPPPQLSSESSSHPASESESSVGKNLQSHEPLDNADTHATASPKTDAVMQSPAPVTEALPPHTEETPLHTDHTQDSYIPKKSPDASSVAPDWRLSPHNSQRGENERTSQLLVSPQGDPATDFDISATDVTNHIDGISRKRSRPPSWHDDSTQSAQRRRSASPEQFLRASGNSMAQGESFDEDNTQSMSTASNAKPRYEHPEVGPVGQESVIRSESSSSLPQTTGQPLRSKSPTPATDPSVDKRYNDNATMTASFGPEMAVLAIQRGMSSRATISIQFHVKDMQAALLARWVNLKKSAEDLSQALCLSLACYSSEEMFAQVRQHSGVGDPAIETVCSHLRCIWPANGHLSMNAQFQGKPATFPLAPPVVYLTPGNYIDVSPLLTAGENVLQLHQAKCMDEYTFVLHAHRPTAAQLDEVARARQRDAEWMAWTKQAAQPLKVSIDWKEIEQRVEAQLARQVRKGVVKG